MAQPTPTRAAVPFRAVWLWAFLAALCFAIAAFLEFARVSVASNVYFGLVALGLIFFVLATVFP